MKHFVTVFPLAENVDLVKDGGQIPYHLQKHFEYTSTFVCGKNSPAYPYAESEVKGLDVKLIEKKEQTFFWRNAFLGYIWRNARSIDVLNLYYLIQESMLYGLIYKYRNPEGVLYLKMDMDVNHYQDVGIKFSENALKNWVHLQTYKLFKRKVDLVSVETDRAYELLRNLDEELIEKTFKLTNGIDLQKAWKNRTNDAYEKKQDIILSVGRIGSASKNNEFLLRALEEINMDGWKVYFIGPIEKTFRPQIKSFFEKNPSLKDHVFFTGRIQDRDELLRYYFNSKVICMTSNFESFAIVLLEALSAGNYIIGTDRISSIEELTKNEQVGTIVGLNDVKALKKALVNAMDPEFYTEDLMNKCIQHARQYDWSKIVKKLDAKIKGKM